MKQQLPFDQFFLKLFKYQQFLSVKKIKTLHSADGNFTAVLKKTTQRFWVLTLSDKSGKKEFISFIRPFQPTEKDLAIFNEGFVRLQTKLLKTKNGLGLHVEQCFDAHNYQMPICPMPMAWNDLYKRVLLAQNKLKDDNLPPTPLILAAWNLSSNEQKRERWLETVLWIIKFFDIPSILDEIAESDFYYG